MSTKTNLLLDLGILGAFLVALEPKLTGVAIHEWLSLAFAGTLIVHLLLHWKWVVSITKQFFKKLLHVSRLQLVLDTLLFVAFTTVMTSGLMISKTILPTLGIQLDHNQTFRSLHSLSADATLLLVGLHFALNWNWVVNAVKRHIVAPVAGLFHGAPQPVAVPVEAKAARR
jgi:hypothetical protein